MNKKIILGIGFALVVGAGVIIKLSLVRSEKPAETIKEINVGQDVCGEFPKDWVQSVINKTIIRTEKSGTRGTYVCQYYVDENDFVTLRLNNLNFENQKKGQQTLGRTILTNDKIQMNHFVARQSDKVINDIVLEINANMFLAVDRSSTTVVNEAELVDLAARVAERIQKRENQGSSSAVYNVPEPQEKDIVYNFFELIDEGDASGAVGMMAANIRNNDSNKQAFAVQFAAMESVKIGNVSELIDEDWTEAKHKYKVILDVAMNPDSVDEPIPYYGFEPGENVRFVNLVKEGNQWRIEGLATGP